MNEWKTDILVKHNLVELVPDNVFLYKFGYWSEYTDAQMQVICDLGLKYQILSVQMIGRDMMKGFSNTRMIIVVEKKEG